MKETSEIQRKQLRDSEPAPLAARVLEEDDKAMFISERKQMKVKKYHQMLGHASIELTKKTANRLGIKLVGSLKTCEDCILAKIRRKNLNKLSLSNQTFQGKYFSLIPGISRRRV